MTPETISLDGSDGTLGPAVRTSLRSVLKRARSDRSVIVMSGGPGSWDHRAGPDDAALGRDELHPLVLALLGHPGAVVGYAQGRVGGLGLSLFLACDVRLAAPGTTYSLGQPSTLTALVTGSYRLMGHRVGRGAADDLAWTGRTVEEAEARAMGLLNEPAMTEEQARAVADDLAATTPAVSALKRASLAGGLQPLTEQLRYDSWLALAAEGA